MPAMDVFLRCRFRAMDVLLRDACPRVIRLRFDDLRLPDAGALCLRCGFVM